MQFEFILLGERRLPTQSQRMKKIAEILIMSGGVLYRIELRLAEGFRAQGFEGCASRAEDV